MKTLISKGACFLVGDGAMIDIWKDPWVPWLPNFTPSPKDSSTAPRPLVVACLINQATRSWNIGMLEALFNADLVEAILNIPIPSFPKPDRLVWIVDPKGLFSVESALKTHQIPATIEPSNTLWNCFWKLKMHDRLKIFLWRIGSNSLPTKLNIAKRLRSGDTLCPCCNLEEESIIHLFFKCHAAKAFWYANSWGIHSDNLPVHSCSNIIKLLVDPPFPYTSVISTSKNSLQNQSTTIFALTLECIWNHRNKIVHEPSHGNFLTLCKGLEHRVFEHWQMYEEPSQSRGNGTFHWIPPSYDAVKLNVDAAWKNGNATLAVVARDSSGSVIKAWARQLVTKGPATAEASAIKWALVLANQESFLKVTVESDAKVCINALLGVPDEANWNISNLCTDIQHLALDFVNCVFVWIKREANMVAHELAKFVFNQSLPFSCNQSTLPTSVMEAWQRDVISLSLLV